jgi:hypothetical protein
LPKRVRIDMEAFSSTASLNPENPNRENPVGSTKKGSATEVFNTCKLFTGRVQNSPLEIWFRHLARNFFKRILTNEAHFFRTTLEDIIDRKENPVNLHRADTVPIIEAFRDMIPMEHLIRKASLPLYCVITFTSIMSRPNVGMDRWMKLAASSEPTCHIFGTFSEEERWLSGAPSLMSPNQQKGPSGVFRLRL